jgi:putative oxidoreductase
MTTHTATVALETSRSTSLALPLLVLTGRAFYAAIFIIAALGHFSPQMVAFAAQQGVPLAPLAVPLSGVIALLGGLSVLTGYHARIGAGLLVVFLVPVTLMLHAFWAVQDPMMAQIQQAMFFKNLSMLGGALLIAYFGAGPLSLDSRRTGGHFAAYRHVLPD